MNTDKLKNLVNDSDIPLTQKHVTIGFIERAKVDEDKRVADRQLIEKVAYCKNLSEIVLSTDDVIIYTVYSISKSKNNWDDKFPFRSIFKNSKGAWQRTNTVSPSLDLAFLVYLETKHLGLNSQFVSFAAKMLGINITEEVRDDLNM